jgi:hypothetical protein
MLPPEGSRGSLAAIVRKSYWRAEDARVVLAAWRESGLALAAFSQRHGVSRGRLVWWRDRVKPPVAPRFFPVQVVRTVRPPAPAIEVIPGSRRVVVPAGFDAAHLQAVLRALEDAGC